VFDTWYAAEWGDMLNRWAFNAHLLDVLVAEQAFPVMLYLDSHSVVLREQELLVETYDAHFHEALQSEWNIENNLQCYCIVASCCTFHLVFLIIQSYVQ
jgi:hypothetical protein